MAITAHFLKAIMAEARPIIERQMDDAKLIAGFRDVVAANGGDWGALKALIKAHVEDDNDETGNGKRVQKIRDKADSTSAYADMLGLGKMNENNFSAGATHSMSMYLRKEDLPPHDAVTGEIHEIHERPSTNAEASPEAGPQAEAFQSQGTGAGTLAGHEGRSEGEAASADLPTLSDADVPAFLKKDHPVKTARDYRTHCLNPEACAASGLTHCYSCSKAMADQSEAA